MSLHIAVLIDSLVGHFYPTLGLTRALRARGHRVHYLGVPDIAPTVRAQGCEFIEIMGDVLPAGSIASLARSVGLDSENERLMAAVQQRYFGPLVNGQVLDHIVREERPEVLLAIAFLGLEALAIHFRYGIPVILLNPFIRDQSRLQYYQAQVSRLLNLSSGVNELIESIGASGRRLRSLNDLADLIATWPELALYAKAFELPGAPEADDPHVHHIGVGVDLARQDVAFAWDDVDLSRPLVYCSLGSHPSDYGGVTRRFFSTMIEAAAAQDDWQLILATGRDVDTTGLSTSASRAADGPGQVPAHVIIRPWAPQMEVLRRAAVMVTHAGMGAVNECICAGVPMAAFPLARDQHQNAVRIVHHGLGLAGDAATVAPDALRTMVTRLMAEPRFAARVALMRERSRASQVQTGVAVVEQAIDGTTGAARAAGRPAGRYNPVGP